MSVHFSSRLTWIMLFLFSTSLVFAQTDYKWHKRIGAAGNKVESIDRVVFDGAGNAYVSGQIQDSVQQDIQIPYQVQVANAKNGFIAKFDPNGNLIWVKTLVTGTSSAATANVRDMVIDDNTGKIYFCGVVPSGQADLDPGPGTEWVVGNSFIACWDASGNFLWGGGYKHIQIAQRVYLRPDGNVVVAVSFLRTGVAVDMMYGPGPTANGISSGSANVRYIPALIVYTPAGAYNGVFFPTTTFANPTTPILNDFNKGSLFEEDAIVSDFVMDNGGNYYVSINMPWFNGQVLMGREMIIAKWNNAGVYQGMVAIGSSIGSNYFINNLTTDHAGSIYATGQFVGSMDFDPGPGVANLTSCYANTPAGYVLKLDTALNYQNAVRIFSNLPCANVTTGTQATANDIVFAGGTLNVVGRFQTTIDFDPGPGDQNRTSLGGWDNFLLQLDTNLDYQNVITFGGTLAAGLENAVTVAAHANGNILTGVNYDDDILDINPGPATTSVSLIGGQDGLVIMYGGPSCPTPQNPFTSRVAPTTARLNWTAAPGVDGYLIRGRGVGLSNWIYLVEPNPLREFVNVSGLNPNIPLEWQIASLCDGGADTSAWSPLVTFTPGCYPPDSMWNAIVTSNAAQFNWNRAWGSFGYNIRGRIVGTPTQGANLVVGGGTTVSLNVFNLVPSTNYEWRIRNYCDQAGTYTSAFTPWLTFTTSGPRLDAEGNEEVVIEAMLYPNPTNGIVKISTRPEAGYETLSVSDLSGRTLLTKALSGMETIEVDLSGFASGIYLFRLTGQNSSSVYKIIRE